MSRMAAGTAMVAAKVHEPKTREPRTTIIL
jgi:hypothetical protein